MHCAMVMRYVPTSYYFERQLTMYQLLFSAKINDDHLVISNTIVMRHMFQTTKLAKHPPLVLGEDQRQFCGTWVPSAAQPTPSERIFSLSFNVQHAPTCTSTNLPKTTLTSTQIMQVMNLKYSPSSLHYRYIFWYICSLLINTFTDQDFRATLAIFLVLLECFRKYCVPQPVQHLRKLLHMCVLSHCKLLYMCVWLPHERCSHTSRLGASTCPCLPSPPSSSKECEVTTLFSLEANIFCNL